MTTKARGMDLMVEILARIERTPELWYQGDWVRESECGTTYCIAGWAGHLTGHLNESGVPRDKDDAGWPLSYTEMGMELLALHDDELFYIETNLDAAYAEAAKAYDVPESTLREAVSERVGQMERSIP